MLVVLQVRWAEAAGEPAAAAGSELDCLPQAAADHSLEHTKLTAWLASTGSLCADCQPGSSSVLLPTNRRWVTGSPWSACRQAPRAM